MISSKLHRRGAGARQSGFTLVEVLVGLVVLSVGMLGVAGLFVVALKASSSAISRSQAVNLASDLADRIRANKTARSAYATIATDTGTDKGCFGKIPGSVKCTEAEMATNDIYIWKKQITQMFRGASATATVAVTAGAPTLYTITISWVEPGQDASKPLSYALNLQTN